MPARLELSRRGVVRAAAVFAIALSAAGCGEIHARTTVGPARALTVALDGPASALFAPLYQAQADGGFTRAALAVRLEAAPGGNSLGALEDDSATVAVASEPELLRARDEGRQLVAVGMLVTQPLDAIVSLGSHPVSTGAALRGRTIASPGTPLAGAQLATILRAARLSAANVRSIADAAGVAALESGRATASLSGPWPLLEANVAAAHRTLAVLRLPSAGVPPYSGLVLVVRIGDAHRDGALLRAFLQAVIRGAAAVAADPSAAAHTIVRANPAQHAAVVGVGLAAIAPIVAAATATLPFGYEQPAQWRAFGDWMTTHGLLANTTDASIAITNEFLPGQGS